MPTLEDIQAEQSSLDWKRFSESEYLLTESDRIVRCEFIDGSLRPVQQATANHELVCGQLTGLIMLHLRTSKWLVFKGAMKLRIMPKLSWIPLIYYYPDVMVVADSADSQPYYKTKPKLVIEVLSSARGRDLVEKLAIYKEIDSLEEYVVVGQNPSRPEVYLFRRSANFEPVILHEGEFTLESIGLKLALADLYAF